MQSVLLKTAKQRSGLVALRTWQIITFGVISEWCIDCVSPRVLYPFSFSFSAILRLDGESQLSVSLPSWRLERANKRINVLHNDGRVVGAARFPVSRYTNYTPHTQCRGNVAQYWSQPPPPPHRYFLFSKFSRSALYSRAMPCGEVEHQDSERHNNDDGDVKGAGTSGSSVEMFMVIVYRYVNEEHRTVVYTEKCWCLRSATVNAPFSVHGVE